MCCPCDGGGCCEGETGYVAAHLYMIMTGGGAVKREGKREGERERGREGERKEGRKKEG